MTQNTYPARFLSSYEWTKDRKEFGGYSAISLSENGKSFVMMSDRSHIIEGSIFRHGDRIIGIRSKDLAKLDYPDTIFDEKPVRDTEGLAQDVFGRLVISLESENVILRRSKTGRWEKLPGHPDIENLPKNRGLEALAISPKGEIFAIPEMSESLRTPFHVFRFSENKGWDRPLHLTRSSGFLPVGADFDPQGRLYVLERGFGGFGFESRVRRFELSGDAPLAGETLFVTGPRVHDNLEGLAVWMTPSQDIRLTMVSDDNFQYFQKTEIVEYGLSN